MVGTPRHGWILHQVMVLLFVVGLLICNWAEPRGNPRFPNKLKIASPTDETLNVVVVVAVNADFAG
jgi:K+-transporting ATPase A subunit